MNILSVNAGEIMGDAGMTALIGMLVVFGVLLLLTGIIKVFGMVASGMESGSKATPVAAPAPAVKAVAAAAPIVGNTAEVSSTMELSGNIEPETVAVISAAVASMAPAGTQYAVADIRKV